MISDLLSCLKTTNSERGFFKVVDENNEKLDGKGIALITIESEFSGIVRKCIDNFKNHFNNINLYDFGYLKSVESKDIVTIINHFIQNDIIPLFVGVSIENIANIASQLDKTVLQISNNASTFTSSSSYIKNNFVAFQRHLCELDDVHEIENHLYNSLSLGKLRSHIHLSEPVLRSTELLYINLNALKSAESSEIIDALPTGLNVEELCQLSKYAGTANQLNAIFFETSNFIEGSKITANIIAESIWYLSEGINMKMIDHPIHSNGFSEFVVYSSENEDDLIFINHNISNRWWVKHDNGSETRYLACSYNEYQTAINDELPDRIIKFLNEQ